MSLVLVARQFLAALLVVYAFGPDAKEAAAGTAVATFQVTAQLGTNESPQCRGSTRKPVTLACGSLATPSVLQARPDFPGITLLDGWITYGERAEAYDSVYAASLTTRVIRYEQWEYIETMVSW